MLLFPYNNKAAVQTCWLLATHFRGKANLRHLLALSYLIDRQCLIETGAPLIGGTIINGDFGPACLDMMKCDTKLWEDSFTFEGNFIISSKSSPGDGELSDYSEEVINKILIQYGSLDFEDLIAKMRSLPEAKAGFYSNSHLKYEDILISNGWILEDIEYTKLRQEAINFMNNIMKP